MVIELFDKIMKLGLGMWGLTEDKAKELVDDMIKRGQAMKEERPGLLRRIMEEAEARRKEFDRRVEERLERAVERFKLARKADLDEAVGRLEERLDRLEKALEAKSKEG